MNAQNSDHPAAAQSGATKKNTKSVNHGGTGGKSTQNANNKKY
jgi:hypothetical protein